MNKFKTEAHKLNELYYELWNRSDHIVRICEELPRDYVITEEFIKVTKMLFSPDHEMRELGITLFYKVQTYFKDDREEYNSFIHNIHTIQARCRLVVRRHIRELLKYKYNDSVITDSTRRIDSFIIHETNRENR